MRTSTLVVAAVASLSLHANANLITNGSFELGDFNNTDADPRPDIMLVTPGMSNIQGWTVVGVNGVHWETSGTTTDGLLSVDLQGVNPPGFSSFFTTFATQPGAPYVLSFDAFTGNVLNSASVSVGTLINQTFTGGGPAPGAPSTERFTHYTYAFNAVESTSTLLFQVINSDGFGPVIDNVVVVPEPRLYMLFAAGISILILTRARHGT